MINLNYINNTKKKEKNKHLSREMYDKIQSEYNHFISSKDNSIGLTEFKRKLASTIGTTLSNIYEIIKTGLVEVYNYDLTKRIEFSSQVAWDKRTKKSVESNASKRESAKPFIELVIILDISAINVLVFTVCCLGIFILLSGNADSLALASASFDTS